MKNNILVVFTLLVVALLLPPVAAAFTQQDIWQVGQYLQTISVVDSSGLPIPVATVTDSNGGSYTTTNGTAYLTEPAGAIVLIVTSAGYVSASTSYVVDGPASHTVQLASASGTVAPVTNLVYTPHIVRLRVLDLYGQPLTPVTVTVSYIASTLPSGDTAYLQNAFGVSSSVAESMTNSSVAMVGTTGDGGTSTFTMFPAIAYNVTMVNTSMGVNCRARVDPEDSDYILRCGTTAQTAIVNSTADNVGSSYVWYTEPNVSFITYNGQYQDVAGLTTDVAFNVTFRDNQTVAYYHDFGNPGTSLVSTNFTLPNIRGYQVSAYLTYNRSV